MMKRSCLVMVALIAAGASCAGAAAAKPAGKPAASPARPDPQVAHSMERQITVTIRTRYLLYLPKGCEKGDPKKARRRWPLMLFLHGAGERGENLDLVKKHGPPKLVAQGKDFPFILVSPQCPRSQWWTVEVLTALLDEIMNNYPVDPDRVYVTGLSMGGFGTWALAGAAPTHFAAIVPICGRGNSRDAAKLKHLPMWVFHGARDRVVPTRWSQQMVDAVKAAGSTKVKLTIYPEAGHDSWTKAYDDPELYKWLLAQKRAKSDKPAPAEKAKPAR
jgi:predicted peptidase